MCRITQKVGDVDGLKTKILGCAAKGFRDGDYFLNDLDHSWNHGYEIISLRDSDYDHDVLDVVDVKDVVNTAMLYFYPSLIYLIPSLSTSLVYLFFLFIPSSPLLNYSLSIPKGLLCPCQRYVLQQVPSGPDLVQSGQFDWNYACFIAPVVTTTTTSIILSSKKFLNGDILVQANPGPPGKMVVKTEGSVKAGQTTGIKNWITKLEIAK